MEKDVIANDGVRSPMDLPKETKLSVLEPKMAKDDSRETRHLKELLLLHLDLIQQQQEIILMKDRQLQAQLQEKSAVTYRNYSQNFN